MRISKALAITLVGVGFVAALATAAWTAKGPLLFTIVDIQTEGLVGDTGAPQWLVTVQVQNRTGRRLDFDVQTAKVEAEVGSSWVETENRWPLDCVQKRQTCSVALRIPEATRACCVHLNYRSDPLSRRLYWYLDHHGALQRFPGVRRWWGSHRFPKWHAISRKVELPLTTAAGVTTSAWAHNYSTQRAQKSGTSPVIPVSPPGGSLPLVLNRSPMRFVGSC